LAICSISPLPNSCYQILGADLFRLSGTDWLADQFFSVTDPAAFLFAIPQRLRNAEFTSTGLAQPTRPSNPF
jgi:hypothetical protein